MKRALTLVFIVLFLACSMLPFVGMLWYGTGESVANEIRTAKPKLFVDGSLNVNYLNQLSDYFGDHFAYRPEQITLNAKLASVLATSANEKVILGKEDWLYYASTLPDYEGRAEEPDQLEQIADGYAELQRQAEETGMTFLLVIVPNKNTAVPQYMPERYVNNHEQSNLAQITGLLNSRGVNYLDLTAVLSDESLWYHTDSHWTELGAAVGADKICHALGYETSYSRYGFTDGMHRGDLYDMLYPASGYMEPTRQYKEELGYTCIDDPQGGEAIKFSTVSNGEGGKLFCYRDSFGIALYPYLAATYSEATFSRSTKYDIDKLAQEGYDTVILEIVERSVV